MKRQPTEWEKIFANDMSNNGLIAKQTKILIQKYTCTSMFTPALFTSAKPWKQPKCLSIDTWIKKMWSVARQVENRILFSHKQNKIFPFANTWMDLEDIILSEISQTKKDKYSMMWNLKNATNQ